MLDADKSAKDSDSGFESDSEDETQQNTQIQALETELLNNPSSYDLHVQYIKALRKQGDIEKLRQAREAMSAIFPFSEMWQEWTKDETSLCSGTDALPAIEKLFEYGCLTIWFARIKINVLIVFCLMQSVALWCDYLSFVQEHDQSVRTLSAAGITKARNLFERALVAAGLHVAEGSKIWELYREFEQAIFLTIDETDADSREKQAWEAEQGANLDVDSSNLDGLSPHVTSSYQKTLARTHHENQISLKVAPESERLQHFMWVCARGMARPKLLFILNYMIPLLLKNRIIQDICNSWIRFEREYGALDDFDLAVKKVTPRLEELQFKLQEAKNVGVSADDRDNSSRKNVREKRKPVSNLIEEQSPAKRHKDKAKNVKITSEDSKGKAKDMVKVNNIKPDVAASKPASGSKNENKDASSGSKNETSVLHLYLTLTSSRGKKKKQTLLGKRVSIAKSDPKGRKKRSAAHGVCSRQGDGADQTTENSKSGAKDSADGSEGKGLQPSSSHQRASNIQLKGKNTFAMPRAVRPLGWVDKDKPKSKETDAVEDEKS
ncbi:hypothetical protein RND71_000598 [Anisodus tanguticus]|uniref:Squamous cell carcinoma antigen recognized by T-cells 3 n=1 Tax=Anisodus tanguticus TaxID=243964 RepID=A0AAE1SZQ0_9SOLA|nr:hypothetical protein RND71_000598 [Anisodus tanguticus]